MRPRQSRRALHNPHAPPRSRVLPLLVGLGLALGLGLGLGGCGGLEPVTTYEPTTDPAQLYLSLTLNHRAITLSTVGPASTLQLMATPLDATGAPMPDLPAPSFTSSDTTSVWVTPEGLLQARGPVSGVTVIAELTAPGNVRHADTAIVNVNVTIDPPPELATLSFAPVPPDSAVRSMNFASNFAVNVGPFRSTQWGLSTADARDAAGNAMPGLAIEYRSLDPAIATVDPLLTVTVRRPGQVRMLARATAYGVTKADTVTFTVTWPIVQTVGILPGPGAFVPAEVRLAPLGVVVWRRRLDDVIGDDPVDVTFDDPTYVAVPPDIICERLARRTDAFGPGPHCGTGNMLVPGMPTDPNADAVTGDASNWTVQVRQFSVPGVYRYHSTRTGATGRIVVTTDPDPNALP